VTEAASDVPGGVQSRCFVAVSAVGDAESGLVAWFASRHGARSGTAGSQATRSGRLFWIVTAIGSVLSVVANFYRLSALSMLADEPVYLHAAWRYVNGQTQAAVKLPTGRWRVAFADNYEHPPLAKYLFGSAQLLVGRPSLLADRAVAALCTLLTGAVVFWWLARVVNRWAGLLAGLLVTLVPEHGLVADSFGRYGMLEPVAALFMFASVALAWWWFAGGWGRRSWVLAIATGVAVGLATGCKESGFLGVLGPVALGLALTWANRVRLAIRAVQAACAALVAAIVFLALYLPIGSPGTLIDYMIDYQTGHLTRGHTTVVAGHIYLHPPWWANFWFAYHGLGPVLTVALVGLAGCALILRRDRITAWLAAALVGPVIFLCFLAGVTLSFYWTLWTPAFFALAALGAIELATRVRIHSGKAQWIAAVAVVVALAVIAVGVGQELSTVVTLRPSGAKMVRATTERLGLTGRGVVIGIPIVVLREYIAQRRLITTLPTSLAGIDFIATAPTRIASSVDPGVGALFTVNLAEHHLTAVYSSSSVSVYEVTAPLQRPTATEIATQKTKEARMDHIRAANTRPAHG